MFTEVEWPSLFLTVPQKNLDGEAVSEVHEKALKGQAKSHATV
jgi:hypothetical protein